MVGIITPTCVKSIITFFRIIIHRLIVVLINIRNSSNMVWINIVIIISNRCTTWADKIITILTRGIMVTVLMVWILCTISVNKKLVIATCANNLQRTRMIRIMSLLVSSMVIIMLVVIVETTTTNYSWTVVHKTSQEQCHQCIHMPTLFRGRPPLYPPLAITYKDSSSGIVRIPRGSWPDTRYHRIITSNTTVYKGRQTTCILDLRVIEDRRKQTIGSQLIWISGNQRANLFKKRTRSCFVRKSASGSSQIMWDQTMESSLSTSHQTWTMIIKIQQDNLPYDSALEPQGPTNCHLYRRGMSWHKVRNNKTRSKSQSSHQRFNKAASIIKRPRMWHPRTSTNATHLKTTKKKRLNKSLNQTNSSTANPHMTTKTLMETAARRRWR